MTGEKAGNGQMMKNLKFYLKVVYMSSYRTIYQLWLSSRGMITWNRERLRSIKSVSFYDYYKTWSRIATSKATEYYRTPLLEDPDFIGEYYKWKKNELRRPKEWGLKYAAAMARIARENKKPHKTSYPTERSYLCTTPVQTFPDSQTETDIVTKTDETKERWKRKVLPVDVSINEPWEEEVEDLVAWTNTLDTDALED
ncbi:ubiquitin-conjugating enzyme E2 U isoform X4 [Tursiops truncatus]|uniref:ubiquitin-conjugating enzyme E2 U isoform X4 n=1 Tax=Tursiops truncatus TaxID=9739 RepID=UPI003CCF8DAB